VASIYVKLVVRGGSIGIIRADFMPNESAFTCLKKRALNESECTRVRACVSLCVSEIEEREREREKIERRRHDMNRYSISLVRRGFVVVISGH
jgi:hypothetical protein